MITWAGQKLLLGHWDGLLNFTKQAQKQKQMKTSKPKTIKMKTKPVDKTEAPVVKVDKKTVVKRAIKKVAFPKKLKRQIEEEIGAPVTIVGKEKKKLVKMAEKEAVMLFTGIKKGMDKSIILNPKTNSKASKNKTANKSKKNSIKVTGKAVKQEVKLDAKDKLFKIVEKKGKKSPKKKVSVKKASVKKVAKVSKTKSVTAPKVEVANKVTKLKVWMMEHGINQKELAKNTSLSTNTINRLVNNGHATKSIIKLVSYELKISVEQITELLKFSEPISHESNN